jgi:PAS domain S-box-containing protein
MDRWPNFRFVNRLDRMEEAAALHVLGVADDKDQGALEDFDASEDSFLDLERDLRDTAVEALTSTFPETEPSNFLRARVFAAVEPVEARVVTDLSGAIASISKPFTDLCGYSFEEVRGRKPGSFLQGPGTDPCAVQALRDGIQSGETFEVELLNYHKSGSPYWVSIRIQPILSSQGVIEGYEALERRINSR